MLLPNLLTECGEGGGVPFPDADQTFFHGNQNLSSKLGADPLHQKPGAVDHRLMNNIN